MAFRNKRQRKEAPRAAKLNDIFEVLFSLKGISFESFFLGKRPRRRWENFS